MDKNLKGRMIKIRTDLAIENKEMYDEDNNVEISGVEVIKEDKGEIGIVRIKILDEQGSSIMGKPKGSYITIEIPKIIDIEDQIKDQCSIVIAEELAKLIKILPKSNIMVVGLGNNMVTPDALGPRTVSNVMVTRHKFLIFGREESDAQMSCVSAVTPGVMGNTGIESIDMIKGVVDQVKPDVVIAVDALAARNIDRITSTVQISDTGISPGAGVGNHRKGLNEETLGVKVIALGVPTVIDTSAIIYDLVSSLFGDHEEFKSMSKEMKENSQEIEMLIKRLPGNMIVTTGDIDAVIDDFAQILSNAINIAVHPAITIDNVN